MYRLTIVALLVLSVLQSADAQVVYEVKDNGRRIQLDGFLLEWKPSLAKPFGNNIEFVCDAFKTPEGLSGYCKSKNPVSCGDWTISVSNELNREEIVKIRCLRSGISEKSSYYQYDYERFVSSGQLVVEWVIPWEKLTNNNKDTFNLKFTTINACGDTLPALSLTGRMNSSETKNVWSGTAFRAGVIAVLTLVFISLRRTIRKRMNRKESPRRLT
ncbi:MAG: hypothetical protein GX639_15250 [Fibrobacter sp.]|nr:hypothetical protein [Fibrobacter sp.]